MATTDTTTDEAPEAVATLVTASSDFLPLGVRRVIYIGALATFAASYAVSTVLPDIAAGLSAAGTLLGSVGLSTALANPTK